MKKKYLIPGLVIAVVFIGSCQNQIQKAPESEQVSKAELTEELYYPSPLAYEVKGHSPNFDLPDELSKGRKGNAVLEVFIGKQGQFKGFNLMFIKLSAENRDTLRYHKYSPRILKKEEYPEEVLEYLALFDDYISTLEFIRKEDIAIDENHGYLIRLPMKLE